MYSEAASIANTHWGWSWRRQLLRAATEHDKLHCSFDCEWDAVTGDNNYCTSTLANRRKFQLKCCKSRDSFASYLAWHCGKALQRQAHVIESSQTSTSPSWHGNERSCVDADHSSVDYVIRSRDRVIYIKMSLISTERLHGDVI